MAFANAKIGFHTSSTGGGGMVTIYDDTSTKAQIRNNSYTNAGVRSGLSANARRNYEALSDFIAKQQSNDGGVVYFPVGSDGGGNAGVLTVNDAGVILHTAGS